MDTPNMPSPTTDIPITAPPEKAIFKALFMPLSMAELAVLTLALVATFIPAYPAKAEKIAPSKNDTAVCQFIANIKITNNTTTKIDRTLYSLLKKP